MFGFYLLKDCRQMSTCFVKRQNAFRSGRERLLTLIIQPGLLRLQVGQVLCLWLSNKCVGTALGRRAGDRDTVICGSTDPLKAETHCQSEEGIMKELFVEVLIMVRVWTSPFY